MKDLQLHNATASASGVQLLSPSLHRGLRAASVAAPMTNSSVDRTKPALFDFDSFTLESVRRRHESDSSQRPTYSSSNNGSFVQHTASGLSGLSASSSGGSPRSPSMTHSRQGLDGMDDYDWSGPRSTHVNSFSRSSQRGYTPMAMPNPNAKRMSMASIASTGSATGPRLRAEIVARGWLQRRRGRVLKRWKPQYCVLKTDQRLCLYASEDTVNGKLEGRFQVLRVTYHDRHGSFQVIGIGSDETPYKEEFKPLDDDGWRVWFLALREFFTPASIHEAMERMPELSLLPGVHASLLEDEDEENDRADFGHDVEDMSLRPLDLMGDRSSASNTSSTSSNPSQYPRVHSYAGVGVGDQEEPVLDRKTVLFDANDFPRYSSVTTTIHDNQTSDRSARVSSSRKLYSVTGRDKAASIASSTDSRRSSQSQSRQSRHSHADMRLPRAAVDCPMIERQSQHAMAMLERCGSESVVSTATSRDSDVGAYSWSRI
jgi:hypothetical protein